MCLVYNSVFIPEYHFDEKRHTTKNFFNLIAYTVFRWYFCKYHHALGKRRAGKFNQELAIYFGIESFSTGPGYRIILKLLQNTKHLHLKI